MATTQHLTYRLYQEDDLPGLLRLWEEETNWGTLTPEMWHQWYRDTPLGPCLVMVVVDENEKIAGQEVFIPSRVIVGDQEVRALHLSAPILRKDVRRRSIRRLDHPFVALYEAAAVLAVANGYSLVYALPEHAWLSFARWWHRFAEVEYDCVAFPIAPIPPDALDGAGCLAACPVTDFGIEYETLWQSAITTFPITIGLVRSPEWLRYKHQGHLTLEVRAPHTKALVGYTAIKKQTGLLVDMLARQPQDLAPVLAATLNWLATEQSNALPGNIDSLKAMQTPALHHALHALEFTPVDYKFLFVCDPLEPSLSAAAIAPERWYIMPGD